MSKLEDKAYIGGHSDIIADLEQALGAV